MAKRVTPRAMRIGTLEFVKKGTARYDFRDLYHLALTLRWPHFFLALLGIDLAINLVFALLYLVEPGSVLNVRPGSFADAFFFSIETLATVGYGVMAPATPYGHIISAIEILCGMAFTAIVTGLIFVRFSRPRAKIMFPDTVVVARHNGRPTLMIRFGNGRLTLLADAIARLSVVLFERTAEGVTYRRTHDLRLERERLSIFALTWTVMHVIDEKSPLFGYTRQRLAETDARLFLAVEARDPAMSTTVYDMKDYNA